MKPAAFYALHVLDLKFLGSTANAAEDLSTEQSTTRQSPWFPGAHEKPRWPARAESQAGQGAQAGIGKALLVLRVPGEIARVSEGIQTTDCIRVPGSLQNGHKTQLAFIRRFSDAERSSAQPFRADDTEKTRESPREKSN
jgi:hypothetical protein